MVTAGTLGTFPPPEPFQEPGTFSGNQELHIVHVLCIRLVWDQGAFSGTKELWNVTHVCASPAISGTSGTFSETHGGAQESFFFFPEPGNLFKNVYRRCRNPVTFSELHPHLCTGILFRNLGRIGHVCTTGTFSWTFTPDSWKGFWNEM